MKHSHNFKDLSGKRFGRLVVLSIAGRKHRKILWRCKCSCGKKTVALSVRLISGHTKSCGCLRQEMGSLPRNFIHGHRGATPTPEYRAWVSLQQRCLNPRVIAYPEYGGRGITVCVRWQKSFEAFLGDVGERPSNNHSIDRINNDGNYTPSNVQWATRKQQARNRRSPRRQKAASSGAQLSV